MQLLSVEESMIFHLHGFFPRTLLTWVHLARLLGCISTFTNKPKKDPHRSSYTLVIVLVFVSDKNHVSDE